jgi:hypothetical protein
LVHAYLVFGSCLLDIWLNFQAYITYLLGKHLEVKLREKICQLSKFSEIKQKYQVLFFQTEQTVNRKKSGFRAARTNCIENTITFNKVSSKKYDIYMY